MALIDKDKVLDAIAMYLFVNDAIKSTVPMKVADYKTFAQTILKDVPEVDAIPRDYYEKVVSEMAKRNVEAADIVRCKECRWYDADTDWANIPYCDMHFVETKPDGYCSWGKRVKQTEPSTDCGWK